MDYTGAIYFAKRDIKHDFHDDISVDEALLPLLKFGESELVGTSKATVMTLPSGIDNETLSADSNNITSVVSSSGSDTGTIVVSGQYFSGTDLINYTSGDITLTGQTAVVLPTALARVNRAYTTSAATMVGDVAFYQGGGITGGSPDDDDQVHMILQAGEAQTQKTATSIASTDYWLVSRLTATVLEKTAAWAQVRIEMKAAASSIWYPVTQYIGVSDASGTVQVQFDQLKVIPKNHDVRMVAKADGVSTHIAGGIDGWIASII